VTRVAGLVESVPQPGLDGKVDLQGVVRSTLGFLRSATARNSALDHRAAAGLEEYIAELSALGTFACGLPQALRFIRERVLSLQVVSERPRPGALYVCSPSQCAYTGRKHLFVVGLEEGRVFPSATEDAVLLDSEREQISDDLRLSQDKVDESVYTLLSRLASSPAATVTFSYSCRDTREYRETYASRVMLQAFRLRQGNPALSYTDLKKFLGEPKSAVPVDRKDAVCSREWWLRSVVNTCEKGTELVEANFAAVAQGRSAEMHRLSDSFTEFDGYVPQAGTILDPCSPANSYSVTELEAAAACPFRFFLKKGLKIWPVDDTERDKDTWLDPLTRGSELHDLYAELLRRTRAGNRRPNSGDKVWLMERINTRLQQLNLEMPAATQEIFERESKDFVADVELFFEAESQPSSSTPIGFEVSFGRPLEDSEEALARQEAVEIDLGDGLLIRIAGRIDRIDKLSDTTFEVLDYKTGSYYPPGWQGVFSKGRRLQHALYGLAAVELLRTHYKRPKVAAGVYY
jgi:ATP-dependent helicase/DNAse subunit B